MAARIGNWKLVNNIETSGFYDLSQDIGEENDLTDILSDKFAEIENKFNIWQGEMASTDPRSPFEDY
jgi:hypothetical protein